MSNDLLFQLTMKDILEPAIKLAEEGTPIPYKHSLMWQHYQDVFKHSQNAEDLLIDGKAPKPGDTIKAPKLARCLKVILSLRVKIPIKSAV